MSIPAILEKFGQRAVDSMRDAMLSAGIDEGSMLIASIDFSIKFFGNQYVFSLTMAPYGRFVDKGRRPTRPGAARSSPTVQQKLTGAHGWISRMGMAIPMQVQVRRKTKKGIKIVTKRFKSRAEANRSLSFAIAHKIHKHGYKAKPFLKRGLPKSLIDQVRKQLQEEFKKQVMVEIKGETQSG